MSNIPMIDIGVNFSNSRLLKRTDQIIERAIQAQVRGLILTGTDPQNSMDMIPLCTTLSERHPYISLWSTAGVHPHDAEASLEGDFKYGSWFEHIRMAHKLGSNVIAVGECGLDYERNYSPPSSQRIVFDQQLQLAVTLQKPLFLHQRGAKDDFITMLKTYAPHLPKRGDKLAAVVHCFTDDKACLEALIDIGCYIGITGWIADERRANQLREAVTILPLDRVLLETDAPYLLPRSLRPKPKNGLNEPAYLPHIAEQLSSFTEYTCAEIKQSALHNTFTLFGIDLE